MKIQIKKLLSKSCIPSDMPIYRPKELTTSSLEQCQVHRTVPYHHRVQKHQSLHSFQQDLPIVGKSQVNLWFQKIFNKTLCNKYNTDGTRKKCKLHYWSKRNWCGKCKRKPPWYKRKPVKGNFAPMLHNFL